MYVRPKKALGQHFLNDESIAQRIVDSLQFESMATRTGSPEFPTQPDSTAVWQQFDVADTKSVAFGPPAFPKGIRASGNESEAFMSSKKNCDNPCDSPSEKFDVLEVGPGTGVLTKYLLQREEIDLHLVELDPESVRYLLETYPQVSPRLYEEDFLKMNLKKFFQNEFYIIGNFPYNISSQIFFKILDYRDQIPQVVGMVQKEVAQRLASPPGKKAYGILSVLLQAWYDIEYLFTVGSGVFTPPPKVESAVIRLRRNTRTTLDCDEALFKAIVKGTFNQRRKTIRNSLRAAGISFTALPQQFDVADTKSVAFGPPAFPKGIRVSGKESEAFVSAEENCGNPCEISKLLDARPEQLSVEQFIELTKNCTLKE